MATTITLRAFIAPLTHHHMVIAASSYDQSGFGLFRDGAEIPSGMVRYELAAKSIAADKQFAAAVEGQQVGKFAIADLAPKLQVYALAPSLPLGESNVIPDDHPIWDLVGKPTFLSADNREAILDAFAIENHPNITPADFEVFFDTHYGAPILISLD